MDINELIRLVRVGEHTSTIARMLGLNRRTVMRYRAWAEQQGLLEGALPDPAALHQLIATTLPAMQPPQQTSSVACYREEIAGMRERGMEIAAIRSRLEERHGGPISYSAVWRLVQHLEPTLPEAVVRVEVPPGAEGQVDFGYAGRLIDPATEAIRRAWVFVLVLSCSRHLYAELVFDQSVRTWLLCHEHAFAFFGGVPERLVPDNLKAAIVRASFGGDALAQRAYRECAEHYGFLIDPTRPRTPEHKGKVEQGGVHYVCRHFLAGRDPEPIDQLNTRLRHWMTAVAGQRVHGTTKEQPRARFERLERDALQPLPRSPYDPAVWKELRVYRDCYVSFEGSYYSVPHRFIGQRIWLRAGARTVQLYTTSHELITTHDRARARGERQTKRDHLPAEKLAGLDVTRESVCARARTIGPETTAVIDEMLAHRPEDRRRSAGRVVQLVEHYGAIRLEKACQRAHHFGAISYGAIKEILEAGLDTASLDDPTSVAAPQTYAFVRHVTDFVASLAGVSR